MRSASALVLAAGIAATTPAYAQLAVRRGPTMTAPLIAPRAVPGQIRSQAQTDALGRQTAAQSRADQIRSFATQAKAAVARSVADGLQGLVIARGVTADKLASGALRAAVDATGRATWQGAALPTETSDGAKKLVVINQNESRAVLSWDKFDVGRNTTLQFRQVQGGTELHNKDWVAVNRVVDPSAAPSQILGQIKSDGTVVVINRNGVIFAAGAQVSANSLLASSLDIGNFALAKSLRVGTEVTSGFGATTLQDRNVAFLQNGLLQGGVAAGGSAVPGLLTSAELEGFYKDVIVINAALSAASAGDVVVERGAKIDAGRGGFVILTAPNVVNDGVLTATEGQVSLQGGKAISHTVSTGAVNSPDPNIRGIILRTRFGDNSSAVNSGLIDVPRGYASLGADLAGSVTNAGLIASTTSVSRNGSISLIGGKVTLAGSNDAASAAGLVILPDRTTLVGPDGVEREETVPQGTDAAPTSFKTSQIQIGAAYLEYSSADSSPVGEIGPSAITIGKNALLLAPSGNVELGGKAGTVYSLNRFGGGNFIGAAAALAASKIEIADGALLDISGVKDVLLDASRNSLLIDPVKRNELRDTPNYREASNSKFTLNGASVYVNPRIRGVRDDGVAYVGSPLIEAGSTASQISVTASELMTKGGLLSFNVGAFVAGTRVESAPGISLARGAEIDFSGGWVTYADGLVRSSRLVTADGRIVDIGVANPNDKFVAVADGFTEVQSKFGISRNFSSSILLGERFEYGYDEGRDAGSLLVSAAAITIGAELHGEAFAGVRQLLGAQRASRASAIVHDPRFLQTNASELPAGGFVHVGAYTNDKATGLTGDIILGHGKFEAGAGTIYLDDARLTAAKLSGLSLRTTGGVTLNAGSVLQLANGGGLSIEAGRTIALNGTILAPSGSINARTFDESKDQFGASRASAGSPFRTDDDLKEFYAEASDVRLFDITVSGTLSAAGLWVNDFSGDDAPLGKAYSDGGAIGLQVAENVFKGIGESVNNYTSAADFSGSIRIGADARLNVAAGGYVALDRSLSLTGKGGDVSLINRTRYASLSLTATGIESSSGSELQLGGNNQTVTFTPYQIQEKTIVPSLVPEIPRSEVSFDASSIIGFGFGGGGTFQLVAPDIAMGSETASRGPRIGLDFLQKTGFGTLDLTANKSRIVQGLFDNGNDGNSAFLETERFVVGFGQTLDLTQTVLPSILTADVINALANSATGTDILSIITPEIPLHAWDRKAAHLRLGGLTELDVAQGGTIIGAAGASIRVPRLYSAGTIRIAGGHIDQFDALESMLIAGNRVVGIRDVVLGGEGLVGAFGGAVPGQLDGFAEDAETRLDVFADRNATRRLTNGELFSYFDLSVNGGPLDISLVFTGRVALNEGIHLATGSVTDLSGTALYDPRAPILANGRQLVQGRMIGGGSIATSAFGTPLAANKLKSPINPSNKLVLDPGGEINLDGAGATFDERTRRSSFERVAQWSDAGRLTIGNGAILDYSFLSAVGGDDGDGNKTRTRASGGILDWVAPVIRQANDGTFLNPGDTLYAPLVMEAGFETLIARNGFTTSGEVLLKLGKSFIATTATVDGLPPTGNPALTITAVPKSSAAISAPFIRLASSNQNVSGNSNGTVGGHLILTAQTIDIVGAVLFNVGSASDTAPGTVTLDAAGDIRLIGAPQLPNAATGLIAPGLSGQLVTDGDLVLKAGQVYATTGTGNLQQLLEDRRADLDGTPDPFLIASTRKDGRVLFLRNGGPTPATPWSAGSYIQVLAANIEQNGVLRAPLGRIELGSNLATQLGGASVPATETLVFGKDSLTSVSARTSLTGDDALNIPYGTTTDLIEYFFAPGINKVLTTTPVGEMSFSAKDISIESIAGDAVRVDARGGGDIFAYEFIPGTGGSRDVLDRFALDVFSGNNGLQFPDGRQVYAILPRNSASVALLDPVYSADYAGAGGTDLYGLDAGLSVRLDAASGIPSGDYLLLPAHYALLPGAMRIVENTGANAPFAGGASTLLDGSIIVGGVYATAGTGLAESLRRSFTVQTQDVFSKYSRIETTSGSDAAEKLATQKGLALPFLPRDAARVVLSPLTSLKVAGAFATDPGKDGRGAQVDIGGARIRVAAAGAESAPATADFVLLTTDSLERFHANSLSLGALRTDNVDGTTSLEVLAREIRVDNTVDFTVPELLLAVGGPGSLLRFEDASTEGPGARLLATGSLNESHTGDYIVKITAKEAADPGAIDPTGSGALVRLASGGERLVLREGDFLARTTLLPARLEIGEGTKLGAATITLDSSRTFAIDATAQIGSAVPGSDFSLALSGDALRIGETTFNQTIIAQFGLAKSLTLRSPDIIRFVPGTYRFRNLTIDAGGIGRAVGAGQSGNLDLVAAGNVILRNSFKDVGACRDLAARPCGTDIALSITAASITFGSGIFRTYQFDRAVSLTAREGMYVTGNGEFSTVNLARDIKVPLFLHTPFIIDRTDWNPLRASYVRPDYTFSTVGSIAIDSVAAPTGVPTDGQAPGARIAFQALGGEDIESDITIANTLIRATAGMIDINPAGSIFLTGKASLQVPGFHKTFDDGIEKTVVSASGGAISLIAKGEDAKIETSAESSLIVDNGIGKAGLLNIAVPHGTLTLLAQINPGIAADIARSASLTLDSGKSAFDFAGFVAAKGIQFQGDIAIRTGVGNLDLLEGQNLVADSLSLTADGGAVTIAGLIDTSGDDVQSLAITDPRYKEARIDGGAISLFGQDGVTLTATASLSARTSGYAAGDARQASGGSVTIGIGSGDNAAISLAAGATIDLSATRSGARLIEELITDSTTKLETRVYRMAAADRGGLLALRAPLLANNAVNITSSATITGAREKSIEAYRRFDLDAIAQAGSFSGIATDGSGTIVLDPGAVVADKANLLADIADGTIPDFVRNFSLAVSPGTGLDGYRIRPGAELASSADIRLVANWNLGAGQIVNLDGTPGFADALAEGLLVESPLGPYTDGPLAGQMRYEVIAGKERELFEHVMADGTTVSFVDMLYRVGGTVRGEAPVLSMRSAGNLDIRSSISDGFFVFHDLTNPDYIDYQLGGGDRTYQPSFSIACGAFDAIACADSRQFSDLKPGALLGSAADRIIIQFGTAQQGAESSPFFINAPYNPLANAASAGGTGDPLGVGELFPLLADDSPVHSTSLRMIGGAALDSANPLQIDVARTGSVIVSGETTYQIIATRGTARLGGALQLSRPIIGENGRTFYDLDELLAIIDGGADDEFQAGYLTTLTWGNGAVGVAARAAALDYAGFQTSGRFIGSAGRRTGVSAPLRVAIAFLRDSGFAETYSQGLAESPPLFPVTPNLLTSVVRLKQNHVYVGTKVRTGDGSIDVAAAADIDLRRTTNIVSRTFLKPGEALQPAAQNGGTALYTAGVRVASADLPGGVLPDAPRNILMSIPGPTSGVVMAPVIARNGGSISLTAGQDVLGRRDVWGELYGQLGTELQNTEVPFTVGKRGYPGTTISPRIISNFGSSTSDQAWRYGFVTQTNTLAAIAPNFFTSGVGALSGGDVAIRAGRDVTDLTVALNNSMATGKVEGVQTLVPFSSGDLSLITGRNLNAGQFDIASGVAKLAVGGNLQDAGSIATTAAFVPGSKSALNLARIRVSDATFSLVARGSVTIGALGGLAPNGTQTTAGDRDNPGFVSSIAGVSAAGSGTVTIANDRPSMFNQALSFTLNTVYAPSLALTALNGDIVFNPQPLIALPMLLYPSRYGQLSLLAGGDISNFAMAMSDAAPINFFGSETFANIGGELQGATVFPLFLSDTADTYRRLQHNRHLTHLGDTEAVRIFAGGSIEQVVLTLPKQARIHASGNITDLIFQGQNVSASDITRISAGGDITGTTSVITGTLAGRNVVLGNSIALGGPGALVVEAGRNLGPFVTSAIGGSRTEAGGIRTIGNEANPWLPARGADLSVLFGVGRGAKFDALQSTYLDPAHLAQLDGDLFEQTEDDFGNKSPDRTRYSYAPVLAEWLRVNQPELFASVFGASPPTGDALKELAYARYGDLYRAFAGVRDPLARNRFLIDKLYFRELAAPSDPSSESFNQYIRGYRAVQTLFPASLGYTDNLATYTTDPATVNADHPLGVPVKKLVDGQPAVADKVATGNVDLRLSTFETARGGDITILGPGGNFIAGSVVRTEAQVSRRATLLPVSNAITTSGGQGGGGSDNLFQGDLRILDTDYNRIFGIPQGFEGILTLRGGEIRGFTDGNFVLNQSRLFTQRGGDITLWSSNGDLNAGQGSRNASSFPPIVLRFSPDGTAEVDSAGSVSGAGIGAFRPSLDVLPSSVRLIAPVGTVDAGDAGVRASGDIFVAAARVANADNFAAGGSISGVPSLAGPAAPAVPSSAAAAVAANALRANKATGGNANQGSRIFVDVLGHFSGSGTTCEEGQHPDIDGQCVPD